MISNENPWHDGIVAVYPAKDDYGDDFSRNERYVYCVCAEYQDGRCEALPGTYTNIHEAKKEASRYAKLITNLHENKCKLKPMGDIVLLGGVEKTQKHKDKRGKYIEDQIRKKFEKMMINTNKDSRRYY